MYQFYLNDVLFPIAPGSVKIKTSNKNKTLNLINDGEINILKAPGLSEISFKLLLPNVEYPFARYAKAGKGTFKEGAYYLALFNKIKAERKIVPFVILRTLDNGRQLDWDTSMKVSIEDYTIEENAKEGIDFVVDLKLKQYREYGTKIVVIQQKKASVQNNRDTSTKPAVKSYTIKSGDTLWDIARTQLGNGTKWTAIYNANKILIDDTARKRGLSTGGHWIFPGTVLTIP
ncbi:LysM peptidoglycan-binding domain-containing protein [Scatolibacter rhodanostii]|uniref:LysM peptidoglycan-binding domain-containing protein n=1 Tax=Scatolibacter rhodanostii TaxID=2014781 RepID=UPI000C07A294|nr:LysM peptidoglycan-binding domain-containing protein [Scatolibacter rhodanostii]